MSKADELLAEIDAAVGRLNKARARRAAMNEALSGSTVSGMSYVEYDVLDTTFEEIIESESRRMLDLMHQLSKLECRRNGFTEEEASP